MQQGACVALGGLIGIADLCVHHALHVLSMFGPAPAILDAIECSHIDMIDILDDPYEGGPSVCGTPYGGVFEQLLRKLCPRL